jgi:tripartite-type tricarboxylate transporter receptor subunit TctC
MPDLFPLAAMNATMPAKSNTGRRREAAFHMRFVRTLVLLAIAACATADVHADEFPARPIRIIVTTSAGGMTDIAARILGQHIAERTGQSVIIDDRPGASGNTALEAVAKADPDGYTLAFANTGNVVVNPVLYRHMTFDPLADLVPVGPLGTVPLFLVTNSFVPSADLEDFIAYLRAHPDKVSYAAAGAGTTPDLTAHEFARRVGLSLVSVPFHGTEPAVTALLGNDVQFTFVAMGPHMELMRQGKLRVLAAATAQRASFLPDVPTFGEQGLSGLETTTWYALFAPRGTPQPIVDQLNSYVRETLDDDSTKQKLEASFIEPLVLTHESFADLVRTDAAKWQRIVRDVGMILD